MDEDEDEAQDTRVVKTILVLFLLNQNVHKTNKKLSCRKEIVQLLRGSVLAKYNWKTIFSRYYRSILNHCDVICLQSYRIR